MSTEITSKRLFTQLGDKVIVTDTDICQRILPATVDFKGIEQVVQVDEDAGVVALDFEGYASDGFFEPGDDIVEARRLVALEVADMLEGDGVIVVGRPAE